MTYTIPSDTHVVGDTGHTTDHNNIADDITNVYTGHPQAVSGRAWQALGGGHSSKLQGWFAGLANRNYGQVNVVCLGDSVVDGNGATAYNRIYPAMLAAALNNRFPAAGLSTHGRGWLSPLVSPSLTTYTPSYVTVTGPSTGPSYTNGLGVGDRTYDLSTGYAGSTGTNVAPAAFSGLTGSSFVPAAGTYTVSWTVALSGGSPGSNDANNFKLIFNTTTLATSVNAGAAGTYEQTPVTFTADGTHSLYIGTAGNNGTTGVTYTGVIDPGTTFIYSLTGTTAYIFWTKKPSGGSFKYSVDGGSYISGSTANATLVDGQVLTVSLGSSGAHTLRIKYAGGGSAYVAGVVEANGDESSGIQVHNGGNSGTTSGGWESAYSGSGATIPGAAIAELDPNLIIICLGENDFNASVPTATFQTNLTSLITLLQTACSTTPGGPGVDVPVLLLAGPLSATASAATWAQYVAVMYAIAAGNALVDVFDLPLRYPAGDAANTWNLWNLSDNELSDTGYAALADALCDFLSPA